MTDVHALSGAYAVDALDDVERARFERHLSECSDCREEVANLREASALLADTVATAPPPGLRGRVLADIETVRPLPPVVTEPEPGHSSRRRFRLLVAAAAAVAAVGAGAAIVQPWDDSSQGQLSAADRVLQADDAERYTESVPGGATATVVRSKSLDRAVLVTEDMPAAPDGHAYALWFQQDDVMVLAGIMPAGEDNEVVLTGDAATADGVGISIEQAGTEPSEPSDEVVALFEFEQA